MSYSSIPFKECYILFRPISGGLINIAELESWESAVPVVDYGPRCPSDEPEEFLSRTIA